MHGIRINLIKIQRTVGKIRQGKLVKHLRKVSQKVKESWSKSQGKFVKKSRKVCQKVKESWSESQGSWLESQGKLDNSLFLEFLTNFP